MTHEELLQQYIVCRNECPLRFLEAVAMNGFAVKAWREKCEEKKFERIKLQLIDGSVISSSCRFEDEVKQSLRIINIYIGFARKFNAYGELGVIEGEGEK